MTFRYPQGKRRLLQYLLAARAELLSLNAPDLEVKNMSSWMNPFCWWDYCSGTPAAIATNSAAFHPAKFLQCNQKDKLPTSSLAAPVPCHMLQPAPLRHDWAWSGHAAVSYTAPLYNTEQNAPGRQRASTVTAAHSCSQVLPCAAVRSSSHCSLTKKRERFSSWWHDSCAVLSHLKEPASPPGNLSSS